MRRTTKRIAHWCTCWRSPRRLPAVGRRRALAVERLEEKALLATFAVIGDFGHSGPAAGAVASMVKSWDPQAILTVGDNTDSGSAETIDAQIGQYYHEYIGNYQGSYGPGATENRFFPVLGNHDWEAPGAQPYLDYFTLPGNERYYDFVLDNVHFFAIDSDPSEPDGIDRESLQAQWLQNALANSQAEFKIVFFHHPPYTSDVNGPNPSLRWPFREWGADAVLSGHSHFYERLSVGGLPYFVNGLGGAEIVDFGSPATGSQVRYNANHGAMRIETSSSSLRFEFYSIDGGGTRIDEFTLEANPISNDDFVHAYELAGTMSETYGSNLLASFEAGEPYNIGSTGGKSVWWQWTAPDSGVVTVSTAGSTFDTTLGVYSGTSVDGLTQIAVNDDASRSLLTSNLSFTAVAGQTYRISVDGYAAASGQIALQLNMASAPANDAFAAANLLAVNQFQVAANSSAASVQAGEPRNAGVEGGKSLWWRWTPSSSGRATISTAGSSFDTTLGVYRGSALNDLTSIAANDDQSGSLLTSRVEFDVLAGTTYHLSVDGYRGAAGAIILAGDVSSPPANDAFASRTPLQGADVQLTATNVGGTLQPGEPAHAGVAGGRSVWWAWTAPATGTVTIATTGSSFDTTLGVYTGSAVDNLLKVASNDDQSGSQLTSRVEFAVQAGLVYQIAVDGYRGAAGDIALTIQLLAPPINDNFAARTLLTGSGLSVNGSNLGATLEAGEPRHGGVAGGRSVWWSWTAPASGTVEFSTAGSTFDTTLSVYTGEELGSLLLVVANDDQGGSLLTSRVQFAAVAGRTYHIGVDGYRGASGDILLTLRQL